MSGEVTLSGHTGGSRRPPDVSHRFELLANQRIPNVLGYCPPLVTTTTILAPRPDVSLSGASLHWARNQEIVAERQLMIPRHISNEDMLRLLNTPDIPSSALVWNETEWELELSHASQDLGSGRSLEGPRAP